MRRQANPFWRFSLRLYARPGVEQACLALQDSFGADVNLLLFCCWMGAGGRRTGKQFLRKLLAALGPWQTQVLQPLRRARRAVRNGVAEMPEEWRARLRRGIASVELDAEYVEQLVLARHAAQAQQPVRKLKPQAAAAANLDSYLDLLGAPGKASAKPHVEALLGACFAGDSG